MRFKSLKTRMMLYVTGIVMVSIIITTFFVVQKAKTELSETIEENALNLMDATKYHVRSQYNSILYHKSVMLGRRKAELHHHMDIAFSLINAIYQDFKNGSISEQNAKQQILDQLESLRYDYDIGYFWVNNSKKPLPELIMHPTMPELVNKSLDEPRFHCVIDSDQNLFKVFVEVCQAHGEGYVNYYWPKPMPNGLSEQQPKISYIKLFEPWNWIIGTGVYIDDIDKDVNDRIKAVITDLNTTILEQKIGDNGYFFIFDDSNTMLVHPSLQGQDISNMIDQLSGKTIVDELKHAAFSSEPYMEYLWDKPGHEKEYMFFKRVYVDYFEPLGWYICTSVYKEEIEEKVSNLTRTIIIFSAVFFSFAIIVSLIVSNSITKPLKNLIRLISKTDDDGIPLERVPSSDITELQLLSGTINSMIDSISQSRRELRTSEGKFRAMVESSSDWIWEIDANSVYTYTSPQVKSILGYNPEEVLGKTPFDFMTSKESQKIRKIFHNYLDNIKPIVLFEFTAIRKDGKPVDLESSCVPILDETGKVVGYRGIDRDVTIRKKVEAALLESEEKFRLLADNSFDVIFRMDLSGRFTYVNPAIENMAGFTPNEVLKMRLDQYLVPESADRVINFMTEQLSLPKSKRLPALIDEFQQFTRDGSVIDIEVSATWIYDHKGDTIAVQGITRDITERKRTEAQIRKDLTEKEVMLKEIHHRVKNNLAVITGLLYLQSKRIKTKEQAFLAFEESRNRIFSMALIHEQLYMSSDLSKIDMQSYVKRMAVELKQTYAHEKNIKLDFDIKNVFLNINHAVPCGLILSELISNAYKHAFTNGNPGHITVSFTSYRKARYTLKVKDNGIGLPEEIDTESDKTLGLHLVDMLTKQLDGELEIDRYKGTCFSITFPA